MRKYHIASKTMLHRREVRLGGGEARQNFNLLDPGSCYIDLEGPDGDLVLISASTDESEWCAQRWHEHPEVSTLPHPDREAAKKIKDHGGVKPAHLKKLKAALPELSDAHTVWDLHDIVTKRHPGCKLSVY